jgi:hypothetical protein
MRVFACFVVSKLQRHRCPTFGALRLRTRRVQTGCYIFIYIRYISFREPRIFICMIIFYMRIVSDDYVFD